MNPKTDTQERWAINENLVTRSVGGQVFILLPDSTMHILENESAVFLYNALRRDSETGTTIAELCEGLVADFQVSPERAAQDVGKFVRDLAALEILDIRS